MATDAGTAPKQAAVVYNPIKVDLEQLQTTVNAAAEAAGWLVPLWFGTTEEDIGQLVTKEAVKQGATLVFAAGGDGTVRAVAEGLRDTGAAIALLPQGTGNLLARNLEISVNDLDADVDAGFNGIDRKIDLGIAEIVRENGDKEEHAFLVMAGLGIDAKMISNTNPKLKKAVGWLAYVDAIGRSLPDVKPVKLRYSIDGSPQRTTTVHSIMVGNCGQLPGGILLLPDAKPDDGILDIAALRPRGPFGWIKIWNKVAWENGVLRKSAVGRKIIDLSKDVKDVIYLTGKDLRLTVETPQEFQLDGDEFGEAKSVRAWVDAGALVVKMPASAGA